jgi:hypothetical protein
MKIRVRCSRTKHIKKNELLFYFLHLISVLSIKDTMNETVTTLFCTDMFCVYLSRINEDKRIFLPLSSKAIRGTALWIVAIESFALNSSEIYEKNFESHFHVSVT